MIKSSKIMNIKEVAEYLGVHSTTIYKYAQQGRIPAFKIGSDWRFTKKHIDEWIEERTTKPSKLDQ
jgi:excisionase family DNA binding protein